MTDVAKKIKNTFQDSEAKMKTEKDHAEGIVMNRQKLAIAILAGVLITAGALIGGITAVRGELVKALLLLLL